jgi:nucleoside phosphorylase
MDLESSPGKIITFYSYKGGTGRSMATANIGCLLAMREAASDRVEQRPVLVMDWDLEAPGLHRYFMDMLTPDEATSRPGVIDYFCALRDKLREDPTFAEALGGPDGAAALEAAIPLSDYIIEDVGRGVDLVKAGRFTRDYAARVASFDWDDFYRSYPVALDALRVLLARRYRYCLIDSRTGLTDVSGICTAILPEKLVGVFTPNRQSLDGLIEVIERAVEHRRASNDLRPLSIFPLPSRIDLAEQKLRTHWRDVYQERFQSLLRSVFDLSECDLTAYLDDVQLPHVSYYAYGELVAVREERSEAFSLRRAYENFCRRLVELDQAWEPLEEPSSPARDAAAPTLEPAIAKPRYDIFLSYQPEDTPTVRLLAQRLKSVGVRPFLDEWEIRPGVDFRTAVQAALAGSATTAVFVNRYGVTPAQVETMQHAVSTGSRPFAVLLPGAATHVDRISLPSVLRENRWVDFRSGLDDSGAFRLLVQGVRNRRSEDKSANLSTTPDNRVRTVVFTTSSQEYNTVREHLLDIREVQTEEGTLYEVGTFNYGTASDNVALIETGLGPVESVAETQQALDFFRPEFAVLVCLGGRINTSKTGDVIVATKVYACERTGADPSSTKTEILGGSSYRFMQRARAEARRRAWLKRTNVNSVVSTLKRQPSVIVGPVVAIDRAHPADKTALEFPEAEAVMVNAAGFLNAAITNPNVESMMIVGVTEAGDDVPQTLDRAVLLVATAFCFEILAKELART